MSAKNASSTFRSKLFDIPFAGFKAHIQRDNNIRMIFSGKFGIGKTYFLEHFFNSTIQEERLGALKYNIVHLYPVNYSISSTEDIFGYIKYDIINSFLQKGIEFEESDFKPSDYLPTYLHKRLPQIFGKIISLHPKYGKTLENLISGFEKEKEKFEKDAKKATTKDSDRLSDYLGDYENIPNSIYENDIVTRLIAKVLEREKVKAVKEEDGAEKKEGAKIENVLIIDDLDRIDPEHVFRILNVFAAHMDQHSTMVNKLGFDKIIVVCDIMNLRSIFRTKYGQDADFNGYIDKFYSFDIFELDNRETLRDIAYEAFKTINFVPSGNMGDDYFRSIYFNQTNLPAIILGKFVGFGLLNLRVLINRINCNPTTVGHFTYIFGGDSKYQIGSTDHPLIFQTHILKEICRGYDVVKEYVLKLPERVWQIPRPEFYCNQLIYYVNFEKTFHANGPAHAIFNGKTMAIPHFQPFRTNFDQLVVSKLEEDGTNKNLQYKYSTHDFITLLTDFMEVMQHVRVEK